MYKSVSHIKKGLYYIIIILSLFLVLLPVFIPDQYRINHINPQRLSVFALSVPLALMSLFILSLFLFKHIRFRYSSTDGWLLAFLGYWFLCYHLSGSKCPTSALILLLLSGVYFLIRVLLSMNKNSRPILLLFLCLTGTIEAVWGLGQLSGYWDSYHSLYKFTGSLFNPGPYSGLLATLFPLALSQSLSKPEKKNEKLLSFTGRICCVLTVLLLPAGMSRSAWIAVLCGGCIILLHHYSGYSFIRQFYRKKRTTFFLLSALSILLIAGSLQGIYTIKKDSAAGRLLMWKITGMALQEAPLTGHGPGNFAGIYGNTQARYFATHPHSSQEEYLAGSPQYGFNEYLQISLELGLTGMLLFTGLIVSAVRQAYKQKYTGILSGLTAFLIFAFFSYPFSVLPLSLLFFILLAACSPQNPASLNQGKHSFFYCFFLMVCGMGILVGHQLYSKTDYLRQWSKEKKFFDMDIFEGTVDYYRLLYPRLKEFAPFLFEYGQCLSKTGQFQQSILVLSEGTQRSADPMFFNIIGKNEEALGHYKAAESAYLQAHYLIPHRLYPLYLLSKLYIANGQYAKARQTIKQALELKPKILSAAVDDMKHELKKLYEQLPS